MVKRNRCGMLRNVLDFVRQNYCTHLPFLKKYILVKKMFALM